MSIAQILERHNTAPRWPHGHRIREAREARRWTRAELANRIGVTPRVLADIEHGRREPRARELFALAEALDAPVERLYPTLRRLLWEDEAGRETGERWSVSKLQDYLRCPAYFQFRHLAELPERPAAEPMLGRAVHAGIEHLIRRELGDPDAVAPAEAAMYVVAAEADAECWSEADTTPQEAASEASALIELYRREALPQFTPLAAEQRVEVQVAGVPFTIVLDVITTGGYIRETKTSGRRPAQHDIDKSLQATALSLGFRELYGTPEQGIVYDYLIRNRTPVYARYETARTERDHDQLARTLEGVMEAVAREIYPPNPCSMFCTRKCPFWTACQER